MLGSHFARASPGCRARARCGRADTDRRGDGAIARAARARNSRLAAQRPARRVLSPARIATAAPAARPTRSSSACMSTGFMTKASCTRAPSALAGDVLVRVGRHDDDLRCVAGQASRAAPARPAIRSCRAWRYRASPGPGGIARPARVRCAPSGATYTVNPSGAAVGHDIEVRGVVVDQQHADARGRHSH